MAISVKKLVRRHGALPAAVTALSVGAVLVIQQVLWTVIALSVNYTSASDTSGLYDLQQVSEPFPVLAVAISLSTTVLPFTLGMFFSLWIVAPIAGELRVGHVITRAILATGIGATLWFVFSAVAAVIQAFTFDGSLFGNSFPSPALDGSFMAQGVLGALRSGLSAFVSQLPLGVLAGVLLWLWRKDHAPKHPLSGLIDEV